MDPTALSWGLIGAVAVTYLIRTGAMWLQIRHQPQDPPDEVADALQPADFERAKQYARAYLRFEAVRGIVVTIIVGVALTSGVIGSAHDIVSSRFVNGWVGDLLTLGVVLLAYDAMLTPLGAWSTFGIEAQYGFNRTTPSTFVRDRLVLYALATVGVGAVFAPLLAGYARWGTAAWLPLAIGLAILHPIYFMFETTLVDRLFHRLVPLPPGSLREAVIRYFERVGFDLDEIYLSDASKRTSKANAMAAGVGRSKRVILFDTIVENHSEAEILAAVAHEVGHLRHRHRERFLLAELATLLTLLFLAVQAVDAPVLAEALGVAGGASGVSLIVVMALLYGPLRPITLMPMNALSRRSEYEADDYAAATFRPEELVRVLSRLEAQSLVLPTAHPAFAIVHEDHPGTVDRIRAVEQKHAPPDDIDPYGQ